MEAMRTWQAFAKHNEGQTVEFRHVHNFERALHMCGVRPDEVKAVNLVEDPEGLYYGWLNTDATKLSMVEYKQIFNMQFPYGVDAAIQAGDGTAVRIRIELA